MPLSLTQTQAIEQPFFDKLEKYVTEKPQCKEQRMEWSLVHDGEVWLFTLKRKEDSDVSLNGFEVKKSQPTVRIEHDENFFKNIQRVAKRSK